MSNDEAKTTFFQEAEELLQQMEDALLLMEDAADHEEHLNSVFRAMHTVKGAAGVFGFDAVVAFTHPVETELDRVRSGQREIDEALIATLLACKDHTASLVENVMESDDGMLPEELRSKGEQLLAEIQGHPSVGIVVGANPEQREQHLSVQDEPPVQIESEPHKQASDNWLITLQFKADALRNGIDPLSFLRYLGTLGTLADVITQTDRMDSPEQMDAESCYLGFYIAFNSDADKQMIDSVFEFAQDDCDIRILPPHSQTETYLDLLDKLPETEVYQLGELLIQVGAVTLHELSTCLSLQEVNSPEIEAKGSKRPIGELLVERQAVDQAVVEKALEKQQKNRAKAARESQYIRIDSAKLGQLINLVGELVISNAAMKLMIEVHDLPDVQDVAANVEHLVEEIRDNALQLRMVQIGETFSRFRRIVRDVGKDLNKDIELKITGSESELDKIVVEKISDPLTHLVRNSLDHGIESPDEREAKGKPRKGVIGLHAYHESGHIVIQISDDGAGLDPQRIRAKAEAIGLVNSEQVLTRQEIFALALEPGLSTKEKASDLSGRGVGMDVVKRNIESLRGSLELDSELGKGTTVTIYLPLTLAIIDGFLVGAGDEVYIIPLSMVEECIEMDSSEWQAESKHQYLNLRGEAMPYIRLGEFFRTPSVVNKNHRAGANKNQRESLVVVRFGRTRAGFVVDQLFGEQQTVIKPVGKVFQHIKGISGATVLGSGDVALILDVQGLVGMVGHQQAGKSLGVFH